MPQPDRRVSSAVACCIAAARALDAIALWAEKLDGDDREVVLRRLGERGEWRGYVLWEQYVRGTHDNR